MTRVEEESVLVTLKHLSVMSMLICQRLGITEDQFTKTLDLYDQAAYIEWASREVK